MELNEALKKIQKLSDKRESEKIQLFSNKQIEFETMKNKILSLCNKMIELEIIVNKLGENKFQNGKFFTDGINHELGFYGKLSVQRELEPWNDKNTLISNGLFGIEGGGCCGGDLIIDIFNKTLRYTREGKELEYNCISKMKKVIKEFDNFYKSVYNYVENLK